MCAGFERQPIWRLADLGDGADVRTVDVDLRERGLADDAQRAGERLNRRGWRGVSFGRRNDTQNFVARDVDQLGILVADCAYAVTLANDVADASVNDPSVDVDDGEAHVAGGRFDHPNQTEAIGWGR